MAEYKYPQFMIASNNPAFDQLYNPGAVTPYSGIYRCRGCGHEITHVSGRALPPQNHHVHQANQGPIQWFLAVAHGHIG